jgi:hypothetical protein
LDLLTSLNITTILKKRQYLNNLTNKEIVVYNLYITSDSKQRFGELIGSSMQRKQSLMITK